MNAAESPFRILDYGQLQVQLQVAPVNAANLRQHLSRETVRIRATLAAPPRAFDKVIVIVDASVSLLPPPDARRVQAEWMRANQELLRKVTRAVGFVFPNPWIQGCVGTIFALMPLPIPMTSHGTLEQALDWAIANADDVSGAVADDLLFQGAQAVERARAAFRDAK